ncbi:unnamed protein product [Strongylus vulgaris]|uniref:Sm protein G n=2 Tax=Strongyloidea TaxID=27829 RepID=A0A3P7LNC3_STRVU|nr:unnamed protein product [Strongylus vulgaris]
MSKTHPPELKKYMDKEMDLKLNGNRRVSGVLRGFDPFMNMVIEVNISLFFFNFGSMVALKNKSLESLKILVFTKPGSLSVEVTEFAGAISLSVEVIEFAGPISLSVLLNYKVMDFGRNAG